MLDLLNHSLFSVVVVSSFLSLQQFLLLRGLPILYL